ncbi:MAG: hypothetical protein FJ145_02125 [Deltaproteobacteria bacterium]|nr:hypothetical protein [Deltaproteobacteria bacterium]
MLFSLLVSLLLIAQCIGNQAFAAQPKEPALAENFYGVSIVGDHVWIVGYYGTILYSQNRGQTWRKQKSPTRNALFASHFLDRQRGWIAGSYGTLLRTDNGGESWQAVPTGTTEHLLRLTFIDEQSGWAVGSRALALRTHDGGRKWTKSQLAGGFTVGDIGFIDPQRGWLAGEFGVIYRTNDGGDTWNKQPSPVEVAFASGENRNLFALLFPDRATGFAFGLDGVILKTAGGSDWQVVRDKGSGPSHHLFAATAHNDRLWAVGERGIFLQAAADGLDWRPVKAATPRLTLNSIAFGGSGLGLIVGNRGTVLRSANDGATWSTLKLQLDRPPENSKP